MPVYSGLELTDLVKSDPQVRDMTVTMLTGRSTQSDREAGARAHVGQYPDQTRSAQKLLGAVEQASGLVSIFLIGLIRTSGERGDWASQRGH